MNWYAIHNGQRINYFLGILIAFDQFAGALFPGADLDRTISHRLGRKKLKIAVRKGMIDKAWLDADCRLPIHVRAVLYSIKLRGIPGIIDRALDKIDKGHSVNAIGA
jgi:hypothetical protein